VLGIQFKVHQKLEKTLNIFLLESRRRPPWVTNI
jgi:hypothetical protein